MTNEVSFDHVRDWYQEIEENADEGTLIYLVANFADLDGEDREVSQEQALELM